MTPSPETTADSAAPLRRQLILAQVRIMELEDARDALATRRAEAQRLLAATQSATETLANQIRPLEAERAKQAAAQQALEERLAQHDTALVAGARTEQSLRIRIAELENQLASRDRALAAAETQAAAHARRIEELAAERHALKASRSWRWTAPLRWLERACHRDGGASG